MSAKTFKVVRVPKDPTYKSPGDWAIKSTMQDDYVAYFGKNEQDKENAELVARLLNAYIERGN
jgi:hypothetical protein